MGNGIVRYKAEVDVGTELLIFNLLGFVTAISKECQIKDLLALKFK